MSGGTANLVKAVQQFVDVHYKIVSVRYGRRIIDALELPIKVALSPFTIAADIVGSAPRGFGIPKLASHLAFSAVFLVATIGTYGIALELGKKVICPRYCKSCNGWRTLRCSMCKGTGKVNYQVKNFIPKRGEKATPENVAEAILENRAELIHLPSVIDVASPLPSKDCPTCDGSGVMGCPECKGRLQVSISADNIMEPPSKAYNVMRRMSYPYEHIVQSMRDPKIAAFWLITLPEVLGGFKYDEHVKQQIWWDYKESMRYDQIRDVVAKRKPGWEHLQNVLVSLDPVRARDDPVVVKNIFYYKARKALEAEVSMLEVPPRPSNWGELELPLNSSSWSQAELMDPSKLLEISTLLNAQQELADKILDAQWENKWRQEKLNDLMRYRLEQYQSVDKGVLPPTILLKSSTQESKKNRRRRWFLF